MRKIMMMAAVGAMAAVVPTVPAHAAFVDGNKLYGYCTSPEGSPDRALCLAFVAGAVDMLVYMRVNGGFKQCIPANATVLQSVDIVTKYLRNYPEERSKNAVDTVFGVVNVAFKCDYNRVK